MTQQMRGAAEEGVDNGEPKVMGNKADKRRSLGGGGAHWSAHQGRQGSGRWRAPAGGHWMRCRMAAVGWAGAPSVLRGLSRRGCMFDNAISPTLTETIQ